MAKTANTKTPKAKAGTTKVVYPPAFLVSIYSGPSKILIPFLLIVMFLLFGWPFGTFAYYSQTGFWAPDSTAPIQDTPPPDEDRQFRHMIYMIIVLSLFVIYLLGLLLVKAIWTMPDLTEQS
jgi:hypothetical protein